MSSDDRPAVPGLLTRLYQLADSAAAQVATEVDGGAHVTYRELASRAAAAGRVVRRRGAGPGTRVALLFDAADWCDFVVASYGVWMAGATVVPVPAELPPDRLRSVLREAEVDLVVTASPAEIPADLVIDPDEWSKAGPELPSLEPIATAADTAAITLTSGTTGRPKLVAADYGELLALSPDDVVTDDGRHLVLATPVIGTAAAQAFVVSAVNGARLLVTPSFDPDRHCRLIEDRSVTVLELVPSSAQALLRQLPERRPEVSSVRAVVCSSAPLPASVFDQLAASFPAAQVLNVYSLSEGVSLVNDHASAKPTSLGKPAADTELRIVGEDGTELERGQVGEIWIRHQDSRPRRHLSPTPGGTTIHPDGWVATGDYGRVDDDGYVYFTDRRDDIAVIAGHNVSSTLVEDVLLRHPAVAEAAVVAVPHQALGQSLAAQVRLAQAVDESELYRHCSKLLQAHERPLRIEVVAELPYVRSGKIDKAAIRRRLAGQTVAPGSDAPALPLLSIIRNAWSEAAGHRAIGPDDNLREIGNHSLLATMVAAKLSAEVDRHVPARLVLEAESIRQLAAHLTTVLADDTLGPRRVIVAGT